ncbi:MAG: phospho-N-acetylmuramoyl-pentapeptide-transferase, partial [Lachnospiraceae bacterium]|nr:phospho-N-acetylmuramoyl-pentapeptide-transferase [Lachnospiraceae bacterium]
FFTAVSMFELINGGVSAFSAALAGSLLGFMIFNYHPARVFMGDTGSLALGGAMAACALVLKHQFLLVSAGLLFVIETLSVMLQIGYFKLTKGKRLFKMAPIHHHFEQLGYTEIKVTYAFWLFTFLCCIITYIAVAM